MEPGREWSLEELARRVNEAAGTTTHDKGTVGRWERDAIEPRRDNQAVLFKVFGVKDRREFLDVLKSVEDPGRPDLNAAAASLSVDDVAEIHDMIRVKIRRRHGADNAAE